MNNVWITRLLQAGIGKKIAKNFHKKHSGILTELEDILKGRSLYDKSMRNSYPLMPGFIFCVDVEVSSCMALSPASFSYYPNFSTFFLLSSLAHNLGFQRYCKLLLLDLSTEWCLSICVQSQVLHEPLSQSWRVKTLQFSLLISHHLLLSPFLHSKLNHPELCATIE